MAYLSALLVLFSLSAVICDEISVGTATKGVFYLNQGRYTLTLQKAREACANVGATLASRSQLDTAQRAGMDQCNCGWTSDGTAFYPITRHRNGCGSVGLNSCTWSNKWDAYCFADYSIGKPTVGVFYLHKGRYTFNLNQAKTACKVVGATLATRDQVSNANKYGMDQCNCGWTSDGTAHYPITKQRSGCGSVGLNSCTWSSKWDAYCYKKPQYTVGQIVGGVFYLHKGRYDLSKQQAEEACKAVGATLASTGDLDVAVKAGMTQCSCGWTSNGGARYPMARIDSSLTARNCGGWWTGVRGCYWGHSFDAYCKTA